MTRLQQQIRFILEADKLKQVFRRTLLTDASRLENAAEHSWQLAIMAMVLAEHYYPMGLDLPCVLQMLLIHDLVEIDAGDVHFCDTAQRRKQMEKEAKAADRLFNLLPHDQAQIFFGLWQEFENQESEEAIFAHILDRLQPLLHGYVTEGRTWRENGVTRHHLLSIVESMKESAPEIHDHAAALIADAVGKGFLPK
ncbi:MAG: HD domain-containing protein [Deltaproteobacteria bacterium]|nr:HD domain-containing protein [Deltaproteobacteria bacterium]